MRSAGSNEETDGRARYPKFVAYIQRRARVGTGVIAMSILGLTACATHRHTLTGTARMPLRAADVHIYLEPLTVPYVEIAVLEASSKLSWSVTADAKTDVVLERLQQEAAALGANGIMLQDMTYDVSSTGVGAASDVTRDHRSIGVFIIGPGSAKVGRATAIYVAPH